MFCEKCGAENRNDSKFCHSCGQALPDYTQPKTDLLMPEDVKKQQEEERTKKSILHINKILTILAYITFVCAGLSSFISLFLEKGTWLLIVGVVCFVVCLGLMISKSVITEPLKDKKDK